MNFLNFKKNFTGLVSGYIIFGPDKYFQKKTIDFIIDECNITLTELNIERITSDLSFFDSLNQGAFVDSKKVIIYQLKEMSKLFKEEVERYLKSPNDSSVFILILDKSPSLKSPNLAEIECKNEDSILLSKWIFNFFYKEGKEINLKDAKELAENCGCDMSLIFSEVTKLNQLTKGERTVKAETIASLIEPKLETKVFALASYIVEGQNEKALALFEKIEREKQGGYSLLALLQSSYRKMFLSMVSQKSNDEIAALLSAHPYSIKKARESASKSSKLRLMKSFKYLSEIESQMKMGKFRLDNNMAMVVLKLMSF